MSANTKIEWADHTFNPWIGCSKISPGCDHCYAELERATKALGVVWGSNQARHRTAAGNWALPKRWNSQADAFMAQHGRRQRVFCASLADVFDNAVDPQWRADLFELIEATPNLDWLLLTKRIGNVERMVPEATDLIEYGEGWQSMWGQGVWPTNVWLGATIIDQAEADRDIPKLLSVPAAKRFLSMEPLLGPVSFEGLWVPHANPAMHENMLEALDWVIVGGESGPNARPMHPDWARSLRDQCEAAGVPFLFKQWGEWLPTDAEDQPVYRGEHRYIGRRWHAFKVGKATAGRLLDGRTWDGTPS